MKWVYFSLCLVFLTASSAYQADHPDETPSFTGNYWLFTVDEDYQNFDLSQYSLEPVSTDNLFKAQAVSASGRYVIGQTFLYSFDYPWFIESTLYVWDVSTALIGTPTYTNFMTLDEDQANGVFAIAPDDSMIAIHAGDEISLWSLPDLEYIASLHVHQGQHASTSLAWSPDSQALLIGHDAGQRITEWTPGTNESFSYPVEVSSYVPAYDPFLGLDIRLVGLKTGWLYSIRNANTHLALLHCLRALTQCTAYVLGEDATRLGMAVSGDYSMIVAQANDLESPAVYAWHWQGAGYEQESISEPLPSRICPNALSFTGRYLYSHCGNQLWDTETWQIIRELEKPTWLYWLTEDAYYVTLEHDFVLRLYDVTHEDALQALDIAELEGIEESLLAYTDLAISYTLSADGRLLLVNLGGYLGVFEIG